MSGDAAQAVRPPSPGAGAGQPRARLAAAGRWTAGITLAVAFHLVLIVFTRVHVAPAPRADALDSRVSWLGDRVFLEGEDTQRGQELSILVDDPLFLVTPRNYAGARRHDEETRPPGQIFGSFEPLLVMPTDRSPPGLLSAPTDRVDPVVAVQSFRWPYLARFGRADPVDRTFEARRARLEVRSSDSGSVVLADSIPAESNRETPDAWPDWRPFEMFVTVSDSGRLSEPLMLSGSGSDDVDRFMRDYVRRSLRLDLRLGPGNYRISIGP